MRKDQIIASERDINRILSLVDDDNDGFVNLTQLINLLSLLFAKQFNLVERIETVGLNRINVDKLKPATGNFFFDCITPFDADMYLDFLNEFYSPDPIGLMEFENPVRMKEFAEKVLVIYKNAIFVV